jgi:geranylgeranylglycerol-phosphate geranylgeranyltransferase
VHGLRLPRHRPNPTRRASFFTGPRVSAFILIAYMNGLMTYFTYFQGLRGRQGGRQAHTYIVRAGVETARKLGIYGSLMPTAIFFAARWSGNWPFEVTNEFIFCGVMTIFLQVWTAVRYFSNPIGPRSFFSLATNFRACACGQVAIIAIFNGPLAMYLFNATYIFVGFLFGLYDDDKA